MILSAQFTHIWKKEKYLVGKVLRHLSTIIFRCFLGASSGDAWAWVVNPSPGCKPASFRLPTATAQMQCVLVCSPSTGLNWSRIQPKLCQLARGSWTTSLRQYFSKDARYVSEWEEGPLPSSLQCLERRRESDRSLFDFWPALRWCYDIISRLRDD